VRMCAKFSLIAVQRGCSELCHDEVFGEMVSCEMEWEVMMSDGLSFCTIPILPNDL